MELVHVGSTALTPKTEFLWENKTNATIEIATLGDNYYLVRAVKAYRLLKQDKSGRENWDRNLRKLNDYLAATFPSFRISLDYVNEITPTVLPSNHEIESGIQHSTALLREQRALESKVADLEDALTFGIDELRPLVQQEKERTDAERTSVNRQLDRLIERLERRVAELQQWNQNGVMAAHLFSFSTDPEIVVQGQLEETIENHLEDVFNYHRRKIKQVLQGSKFKLVVEDITEPPILNRLEYTLLYDPETIDELIDTHPDLQPVLTNLREESTAQYNAFALQDLSVDGKTFELSKATPARALQSVVRQLETQYISDMKDVPADGPLLGWLLGSELPVGIDLGELYHVYINGATRSGKSYLKRVLIETCLAMGYYTISLTPTDTEPLSAAYPNPNNPHGQGIAADYYWIGNDLLLDRPDDLGTLLKRRASFISLDGLPKPERDEFLVELLTRILAQRRFDKPLFLFIDEAHRFADGHAADCLNDTLREAGKHGVHLVLSTQHPMDFSHSVNNIRQNTSTKMFLQGEYEDYAGAFLDDSSRITKLKTGEVIIQDRDLGEFSIKAREPVSLVKPLVPQELEPLDARYQLSVPDVPAIDSDSSSQQANQHVRYGLSDDEQTVIQSIREFNAETDSRPTQNELEELTGWGNDRLTRSTDSLSQKGIVEIEWGKRNYNDSKLHSIDTERLSKFETTT